MPTAKRNDPAELLRLALDGLDTRIAELQEIRTKLAAMIDHPAAEPAVGVAAPQKRRTLSAEARAKISAAAKARWDRERKTRAKKQKPKKTAKKAQAKGQTPKSRSASRQGEEISGEKREI